MLLLGRNLRGEVAAFACQDGDVDVLTPGNFAEKASQAVIEVLGEGIEFMREVESDDSNLALGCQGYLLATCRHDS